MISADTLTPGSCPSQTHIVVGMSGGVDSSVAAYLLKAAGYQVAGLFMKNWEEDDTEAHCSAAADLADAQGVCDRLDIPLHKINFAAEYWDNVFAHFLAEYRAGRTPNPDILCNKEIKFKAFLDYAQTLGANYIATGHYVQRGDAAAGGASIGGATPNDASTAGGATRSDTDRAVPNHSAHTLPGHTRLGHTLLKGADANKDQSYFLYTLGQAQLAKSLFPIGALEKPEVRRIAAAQGFANHNKKDSTGICFIGERKFKAFLNQYLPAQPGDIISVDDKIMGTHDGLMFYTLGQRQGIGLGGVRGAAEAPWYVVEKDLEGNRLIVAQEHDHPRLLHRELLCHQLHWVAGTPPAAMPLACRAKTRYRQAEQACDVHQVGNDEYRVTFAAPQWAITPGQSVVFYDGGICLGGGVIATVV